LLYKKYLLKTEVINHLIIAANNILFKDLFVMNKWIPAFAGMRIDIEQ